MLNHNRIVVGSKFDFGAIFLQKTIIPFILVLSIMVFFSGKISYAQNLPELFHQIVAEKTAQRVSQLPSEKITGFLDFFLMHPENILTPRIVSALPGKTVVLVKGRAEMRGKNNYTWFGTVEGRELSTVVMSVVDGSLYGHIDMEGETYSIKPENGAYVITKNDPSTVLSLEDDVMIPSFQSVESETLRSMAAAPSYAFSEDGSAIDVLVLYTQQMQAKYGANLNSKIQNFIDLANTAYVQSGVNTRLRLAHAELYTAAGAAEGISISSALNFLTADNQSAALRDTYGADLVSLLRAYDGVSSSCGIAWLMTSVAPAFESNAFSVVEVRSASEAVPPSYYYCDDRTFAHELGHNMGCHHDRAHAGGGTGAFAYSYGYDHAGIFGTIMSYVGPRITYFSTPLISYSGIPIGVDVGQPDAAYNVLTINNTRTTVANFRLAGCNFLLSPTSASFGSSGGAGSVTVTASDSSCAWSAISNVPWVTITLGTSGTGSGAVEYSVSENTSGPRTGTLTVAGQTFSVTQGRETDPPTTGSVVINGGAAATRSTSATLGLSATDASGVSQMCVSNTASCTSWAAFAATRSWTLTSGSGVKTVYVWFRDIWGNQNATPFSASIILDTTAPSNGTIVPVPGDTQVTLNWSGFSDAHSGVGGYAVKYAVGSAPSSCTGGTAVPGYDGTSTTYIHLGLINGTTYGYRVCAIDKAGNMSTGATASAKPVPETDPPTTGSVVINGGAAATRSTSATLGLSATDASGVSQMCVSNTASCTSWAAFAATRSWTLTSGSGVKTVYVWFRDIWGNQNATPFSASIILDTTAPSNGTIVPVPGDTQVTLNWSGFSDAHSGVGGYAVKYAVGSAPSSCTGGTAVPGYDGTSTTYIHLGLINGTTYGYRVCAIDKAGNMSTGATASAKPVPETDPPTTGSVVINGGAAATRSTSATLGLSATDASGVSQMCVSNTASCTSWAAFAATRSWTLTSGSGVKTVYVWFRDIWGNQNATPFSASIILDTTAPSNGTIVPVPGDTQVTLNWSGFSDAHSGVGGYAVKYAVGSAPSSCTGGTAVPGYDGTSTTYIHLGLINGTTYGYRVCAIDKAGNMSTGATASAKPVPETDPPTTGSVVINGGAAATRSTSATLGLSATDASGVSQMCVSNTASCTSWAAFTATRSWTLTSGSGVKTVYVWFRDIWGNQNATPFSASIILDTTAPSNGVLTPTVGDAQLALNWSGFADAGSGIASYRLVSSTGYAPYSCSSGTTLYTGPAISYLHTGLTNGTRYYYRLCAVDTAGNTSSGASTSARPQ